MKTLIHSDQELIGRYIGGNRQALELLINRHKDKVFGYIFMIVKDQATADDIFQDTFIKVINKLKSGVYNEEGKFIQWVMRVAHNMVIDHFRRSKRIPVIDSSEGYNIFDTLSYSDPNIEDRMVVEQIHEDVRKLIEFLPDEQKEVLIMRHYSKMSFKDIAESTDVSINTALGRMRYAVLNLRKMIEEKGMIITV